MNQPGFDKAVLSTDSMEKKIIYIRIQLCTYSQRHKKGLPAGKESVFILLYVLQKYHLKCIDVFFHLRN